MIVIRTMSERDSSAVWELEKKCFSVPWSEESIRAMFSEKGYWNLAARDDGSLVGYIGMPADFSGGPGIQHSGAGPL